MDQGGYASFLIHRCDKEKKIMLGRMGYETWGKMYGVAFDNDKKCAIDAIFAGSRAQFVNHACNPN